MAHLITPLLFLGFFSSACRLTVSGNKKSNEHFISLRDYDFVGEDPRLKAALAERMKVLQGEVNVSDLQKPLRGRRAPATLNMNRPPPAYKPKPDYLHSSLNFPLMVNVSLDYAGLYNASELFPETNTSWHLPAPAPGLRGVSNPFPGPGGRRQQYSDPTSEEYSEKVMDLMIQMIYGAQLKLLEIDQITKKYDLRFHMAYIFNRLDEWLHNLHNVYTFAKNETVSVQKIIFHYEHSLRIDIDITYSIEYLIFLHNEYIKNMVEKKKRLEKKEKGRK